MKSIFTLALSQFVTMSAFAATETVVRLDSIVVENDHKLAMQYDEQGRMSSRVEYEWHYYEWQERALIEITYNQLGQLSKVEYSELYQGKYSLLETSYYSYDEEGRITGGECYSSSSGQLRQSGKEEFLYNEKGQMQQSIYYYNFVDGWAPESKTVYVYDEDGNESQNVFYYWESNDWHFWDRYDFTYDNDVVTTDGKKKVVSCIVTTNYEETMERKFYYSEVSSTGIGAIRGIRHLADFGFRLNGQPANATTDGPVIVDGKVLLMKR